MISKNIYEISKLKNKIQLRKINIKNFIQLHDFIQGFIKRRLHLIQIRTLDKMKHFTLSYSFPVDNFLPVS